MCCAPRRDIDRSDWYLAVVVTADLQNKQQSGVDARPLVLVFRASLLPLSETFIRNQVLALRRWRALLIGLRRVEGLDLGALPWQLLSSWRMRPVPGLLRAALHAMNLPPPGVRRYLQDLNPAVAHVHFGVDLVALWPMLEGLRVPILTTLHGYDVNIKPDYWRRSWRTSRKYPERLLEISRDPRVQFIAVSEAIRERAIEFGLPSNRVAVRYIGVDTRMFVPGGVPISQRRRILFVGRMVEKKGPTILIEAFAEVHRHLADTELVMVGEGPLLENCRSLAASLQVPVLFAGAVTHARIKDELDQARVFCLPSITAANGDAEGLSVAIVEAQSAGVPVVTSARGASEAIEHGVTGYIYPEGNVEALVTALIRLLREDALATAMSVAARARACRMFDLQECTSQLESLYEHSVQSLRRQEHRAPGGGSS